MGNDGGTIARGKDLKAIYSEQAHTQDQEYLQKSHNSKVATCSMSSLPLYQDGAQSVVSDFQGKVYLKEKVLEFMLDKTKGKASAISDFDHLKRLSDIVDLHVTWKDGEAVCPLTGLSSGLIYLRQCGCVFSHKMAAASPATSVDGSGTGDDSGTGKTSGVGESGDEDSDTSPKKAITRTCPRCGRDAEAVDVVHLNPKDSESKALNEENYADLVRWGLTHSKSPAKKRKKKDSEKSSKRSKPSPTS